MQIVEKEYLSWISSLKEKIRTAQIKAAVKVNSTLLHFYWDLGKEIVEKQKQSKWGDSFIKKLSKDLSNEFPKMKGFSETNLKYIKKWFLFYKKSPQVVDNIEDSLIFQIPWGHNRVIITKTKTLNEALFYTQKTIKNGWSRNILQNQIESDLFNREGKAITNFKKVFTKPQSDLAIQTLKDPYNFDFLILKEKYNEREFEEALINNITKFLLELGVGFSFVGKQYKISIEQEDFFIDLLFYNIKLHSYIVIELKTGRFKPEYVGKLNFYISAVDEILKSKKDNQTIGIIICKEKNKTIVEYALKDMKKPMGVSEYKLTKFLPAKLKSTLPSIEEIERITDIS